MDHLYLLSFLLTGDRRAAEKCFVSGLEDSRNGNPVFREWARSWARRTIIQNAIRMIHPRADAADESGRDGVDSLIPAELRPVVELPAFDRFVFVMSVLEGYSEQECSLLLNCTRGDVTAAKIRALRQLGERAESLGKPLTEAGSADQADRVRRVMTTEEISHLAATA
ncbi:MAG TPA: hypothetical protein VMG31_11585 [Verrucomicrobiae bacterium]|nr:hypothetical protein [Verrucomicrobiae bacterium]